MKDSILKQALILTADKMLLDEFKDVENIELSLSANFERKVNNLCKKYDKLSFKLTYTRARKVVCVFIAILLIMLSSLSVGAVREAISEFFVRHFSNHDVIKHNNNERVTLEYPEVIEEIYEIQNIPPGYELIDCSETKTSVDTIYLSNEGQIVLKQVVKKHHKDYISNTYISVNYITISNINYSIYEYEYDNVVIWDNGKYIFTLTSNINPDNMLDLCKNLKVKK